MAVLGTGSTAASGVWLVLGVIFGSPLVRNVNAYPAGAGGCSGERGSVGGVHLSPPQGGEVDEEPLADHSLVVEYGPFDNLDSSTLGADSVTTLSTGNVYNLYLQGDGISDADVFKGFLFRLADSAGGDASTFLSVAPGSEAVSQVAGVCTILGIGGVTHTSNSEKTDAIARMEVTTPGSYNLQVTAVFENGREDGGVWESSWAYGSYDLVFEGAGGEPAAPVFAPSAAVPPGFPTRSPVSAAPVVAGVPTIGQVPFPTMSTPSVSIPQPG